MEEKDKVKIFKQFTDFNESELEIIMPYFELKRYRKKTRLLEIGKVSNEIFCIIKGCIRLYCEKEGQELSTYFFTENMFAGSYDSFLSREPSKVAIEKIEDCTPIRGEGYRETMCGTISFYNSQGDRMHTIYSACAPEYGKKTFEEVLDMEIEGVKKAFPTVTYLGLADGAKDNWSYLQKYTSVSILDFFHVTEYLTEVSCVLHKAEKERKEWLENACHDLKHQRKGEYSGDTWSSIFSKGAQFILRELKTHCKTLGQSVPEVLLKTITYFENNLNRMNYAQYQAKGYPIGSGVTEAACKVVVKQRLSQSGMKWNMPAVENTLLLRGLICTDGRWNQFWKQYDKIAA